MGGTSVGYKIIPSYDKDLSKWTKAEKEEYAKKLEEINAMVEAENKAIFQAEKDKLSSLTTELNGQAWEKVGFNLEANQPLNQIRGNVEGYGNVSGLKVTDYVAIVYPIQKQYFQAELEKTKGLTKKVIDEEYALLTPKEKEDWTSEGIMSIEELNIRDKLDTLEAIKENMIKRATLIEESI